HGVTQLRISFPSKSTEQAPHCASPQPNLGPCRCSSLCRTYRSGVSRLAVTLCTRPFTLSFSLLAIPPSKSKDRGAPVRRGRYPNAAPGRAKPAAHPGAVGRLYKARRKAAMVTRGRFGPAAKSGAALALGLGAARSDAAVSQTMHAFVHVDESIGLTFDDGSAVGSQGREPPT